MSFNPRPKQTSNGSYFFAEIKTTFTYPPISFNNNLVDNKSSQKHLGLILDSKLNFNHHLDEKLSKANKVIAQIHRIRHNLSRKSLLTIYKSHIRPHLDYGDIIYDQPNVDIFVTKN